MRPLPRGWLVPGLWWSAVILAAILAGRYAQAAEPHLPPGAGRAFPRLPGPPPDLPAVLRALGVGSVVWYAAAFALPLMLWGARRVQPERLGARRTLAAACAAVGAAAAATSAAQYLAVYRSAPVRPPAADYLPLALQQNLLPWVALAGIVACIEWRRRAVQSELERERLRAELAEQRLLALTGELQPHFLFNTLQGISTLIHRAPEAADDMLAKLSELLRELLRQREEPVVPLEDELRHARTYLDIAKLRFAERLEFTIDAPAEVRRASVPLFLLQPLLENALAHGIEARIQGGRIRIRARRRGNRLLLEVANDGAGMLPGAASRQGIGLRNTRARLSAAFGDDQVFALEPDPSGGVIARVEIPLRLHASPAGAA